MTTMGNVTTGEHRQLADSPVARAMNIGQHAIAVVLTVVAVARALSLGTSPVTVLTAGVVFLVVHALGATLLGPRSSKARSISWLLLLVVVWIGAVAVSPEFMWLAFLLWLLTAHLLNVFAGALLSLGYFIVVVLAPVFHHGHTSLPQVLGPAIGMIFAFGIARGYLKLLNEAAIRERLVASLRTAQVEMAQLQDELAYSQRQSGALDERTRISRDLHDTVAQTLSSIRLIAHAEYNRNPSQALEQLESLAVDSITEVRRIIEALAPAELEGTALATALKDMTIRFSEETRINTHFQTDSTLGGLGTEYEVALLRCGQSALGNVRKHSNATRVAVSLSDAGDAVRLDIIDDGEGFDVVSWERTGSTTSFGLRFMRARLAELGGGLDIASTPGNGTEISAYLPLTHHVQEKT